MHKSEKFRVNLAIFAYVATMMMFCANSSPLFNATGNDSAVFRVMGRALTEGKVMYRDVFDHKGLYLYFINALGVILSDKSLLGLFVIECVFMFLCAKIVHAIVSKFADGRASLVATQIFMMFALLHSTLEGGNLTEEYGLMFQVLAVYMLVNDGGKLSCLHMFMQGVLVGIVVCLRPNIAMMWGGIAIVAGYELLRRWDFARLSGNIAAGIAGVIAGVMPAVVYAVMTGSLSDMLFGTFTYNFVYLGGGEGGYFPAVMLWRMLMLAKTGSTGRLLLIFSLAVSCFIMARRHKVFPFTRYYFAMLFMSIASVALSGRNFGHYYETAVPLCLPFAYWVALKATAKNFRYAVISLCVLTMLFGARIPSYANGKFLRAAEFVKYNEPYYSENERLLVAGDMPLFYEKLGVMPQEKYFYIPASEYDVFPDPRDSQVASILSGVNDVIFAVCPEGESDIYPETGKSREIAEFLEANYDLLHYDAGMNIWMYGRKLR